MILNYYLTQYDQNIKLHSVPSYTNQWLVRLPTLITLTTHITYSGDNCHQQTKYKKSEEILRPAGACRSHVVGTHRICEHRAASCAGTRTPTGKCCHSANRRRGGTRELSGCSSGKWWYPPVRSQCCGWTGSHIGTTSLLFDTSAGGRTSRVGTPLRGTLRPRLRVIQSVLGECLLAFYSFVLLFPFFVYS